jgi:2-oxoglutarate ferredoxin oxidoreductase subunit gamma
VAFKFSIRLSGAGGQGLIEAARILAEAAAVYDNNNASESRSYGPEARGSASRADIIVSDEAINYPRVEKVDFFLALTQEAFDKHIADLDPNGVLVTDSSVQTRGVRQVRENYSIPFMDIAERECSRPAMINIVALGFIAEVNGIISENAIRQAILGRIPKMSEDMYLKAFEIGLLAARNLKTKDN